MSKKAILAILVFLGAIGYGLVNFFVFNRFEMGGLQVVSSPPANVFLNEKLVGKTPYEGRHKSGEYSLKLIPQDVASSVSPWQGRIKINPSLLTYVERDLGISELRSSGEIIVLEKIPQKEMQIEVNSQPDGARVIFDGLDKGTTPLTFEELEEGEHDIAVSSVGFISRTQRVKLIPGYRLSISFQLAPAEEEISPTSSPQVSTEEGTPLPVKPYVLIKDTETGFLRVRSGPGKNTPEIAQVKPGEKYPLLEEKEGWYKISYQEGKEGWISSRYAEKKE